MPAKPTFNDEQMEVIWAAARRVWRKDFEWMKRSKDHPDQLPAQEAFALALGISQQSVSKLLKREYRPGVRVASNIANLDGRTLRDLVGDFEEEDPMPTRSPPPGPALPGAPSAFTNLDVCIQFHASTKHWSPWTIAAARAGFFGNSDFAAPEWAGKLDHLERAMERARKGT